MTEAERDSALLEAAKEHCLINEFAAAGELAHLRVCMSATPLEGARARAWYSYFRARENDLEACRREATLAVDVLQSEPPSEELALALGVVAWVELVEGHFTEAIVRGDEAVAVARSAGTPHVDVYAATTAGTARSVLHDPTGRVQVEEAARVGVANGLGEFAARALNNLGILESLAGLGANPPGDSSTITCSG